MCPSGLAVACHSGGWGCWNGFGTTFRCGILNSLPSHSISSSVQAFTMNSSASSCCARVSCGLIWNPSSSVRVADRPVPNSSRPSHRWSSVAAISAARIGWLYAMGRRRTPWPRRMFSVLAAMFANTTSGAVEMLSSGRKWCSVSQKLWYPSLSARTAASTAPLIAACGLSTVQGCGWGIS